MAVCSLAINFLCPAGSTSMEALWHLVTLLAPLVLRF